MCLQTGKEVETHERKVYRKLSINHSLSYKQNPRSHFVGVRDRDLFSLFKDAVAVFHAVAPVTLLVALPLLAEATPTPTPTTPPGRIRPAMRLRQRRRAPSTRVPSSATTTLKKRIQSKTSFFCFCFFLWGGGRKYIF